MKTWTISEKIAQANQLLSNFGKVFGSNNPHELLKSTIPNVIEKNKGRLQNLHFRLSQHTIATAHAHDLNETLLRKWVLYLYIGPEYLENPIEKHLALWLIPKDENLLFTVTVENEMNTYLPQKNSTYFEFTERNLLQVLGKAVIELLKSTS